jgi:Sulfotransferase family
VSLQPMRLHNRIMVVPEYKLMFCYIEKVGCSMFNQFFRLLRIYHPSVSPEERAWLAQSHFGRANPTHFNLTLRELKHMVNDDQWTKAVFFRDPADRFLSGFKSKCGGADSDGGRHCRLAFGETPNPKGGKPRPILDGSPVSFHHSIDIAVNQSRKVFGNPHFKPAAHFCGGLGDTINHYSFVHMLEKDTVSTHLKTLLDHLGVDSELASGLLERVVKTGGMLDLVDINRVQEQYGLKLRGTISLSHHTEEHHVTAKDYFKAPNILQKLQSVYKMDYDMFQLERPRLEDI